MSIRHKLIIPSTYMITGMCGVYLSMYQISLVRISQRFDLSNFMMGAIVALQFAALCLPPLFLGTLSERIGKRGVIIASIPLIIFGTFIISITASIGFFIAGIIFIGAGFSVTEATVMAILGAEFPKKSTLHLGAAQAMFSLGAVLSPFACKALFAAGVEYNAVFGMVSATFAALFVLFLFTEQRNDKTGAQASGARAALKFFSGRVFVFMAASMVMYMGAEALTAFFADSYFDTTLGAPALGATALSLFWAGMIPTRLLMGAIKQKHSTAIIGCAAGIMICAAAILFAPGNAVRLAAFCGMGAFCGPCWPLIMDVAAKRYPQNVGTVSNLMMSMGGLGGFIMPLFAGLLITGVDFGPGFIIAGACALVMAGSIYIAQRARGSA